MMRRVIVTVFLLGLIGVVPAQGSAPGQYNWEEFSKRIKTSQAVGPLGPDLMGEKVSLSNGALSFSATDVSLPGSDKLPVAFVRAYSIGSLARVCCTAACICA